MGPFFVEPQMAFWVYILQSETTGRLYTGQTSDLEKRLRQHNDEEIGGQRFTRKQSGPWRLLYSEEMRTRSEAMRREKQLKSGKGGNGYDRTFLVDSSSRSALLRRIIPLVGPPQADPGEPFRLEKGDHQRMTPFSCSWPTANRSFNIKPFRIEWPWAD